MPWNKLSDVHKTVRTHKGASLTLVQANFWARVYDSVVKTELDRGKAAAIAWSQFEKQFKKTNNKWVSRAKVTFHPLRDV